MGVLRALLSLLFPLRDDEKLVQDLTPELVFARATSKSFTFAKTDVIGLLPYRDTVVAALIKEAKFRKNAKAIELLGTVLADHLLERTAEETAFGQKIALIPLPLSVTRKKERGYNQTEEVCKAATTKLGDSVTFLPAALMRTRDTLPQTTLSGTARRENMRDAFSAATTLDPVYSYILVDDVVTTGATLSAAIDALRLGGAMHISAIALAH
jgi:ComF family protein